MNYILQLKQENAELRARIDATRNEFAEFKAYLQSTKFTGNENGARKDWISTTDVHYRIQDIQSVLDGTA